MVDRVHVLNDDEDDDQNMDNIYEKIVNVFLFDDIEVLEDKYMDKIQMKILDCKLDLLDVLRKAVENK